MDVKGRPIGQDRNTPMLDTRQYEVEFLGEEIEVYTANIIDENLLSQVDYECHRQMTIGEIVDHRVMEESIPKNEGTFITRSRMKRKKRTKWGWEICVQWKDGSTNWIALKGLKDSYSLDLENYAVTNKIQDELTFAWWVPYVLIKRKIIISKLRSKYWKNTHKYGIQISKSMKQVKEIDK